MKNYKAYLKDMKIIPYIMIGEEGLDFSMKQYDYYIYKGCKIIELGIPFSDPSADGTTIQNSSISALSYSITIYECLSFIKACKAKAPDVKLIVMSYLNPIYSYGLSKFFNNSDIDGLIIPDLPYEMYDLIKDYLEQSSISFIPLVAIDTDQERFKQITSIGSGFIYLMSVKGITGSKEAQLENVVSQIKQVEEITDLPIVLGFGIKEKSQINALLNYSEGVIMASQLIRYWRDNDLKSLDSIFDK